MKSADVDTSGFQNIVLMLVGVLMIMLISNVLTIISNPDNIKIGALISGTVYEEETGEEDKASFVPPKFNNMEKNPVYVEVDAHRITVYPEYIKISDTDLRLPDNDFEKFLDRLSSVNKEMKEQGRAEQRYVVLLLRPDSALFQRRVRKLIRDRGIDVGFEPWESSRKIKVGGMTTLQGEVIDDNIETAEEYLASKAGEDAAGDDGTPTEGGAPEAAPGEAPDASEAADTPEEGV